MSLEHLIAVARGERPADLILANARVVNTFTAEVEETSVAIAQGRVAGLGDYREAAQVLDLGGKFVAPALIDGHVHLESSYLAPAQYARAVVPRGVMAVVTDGHEIANVRGLAGLRYLKENARGLPLDVFLMAPSCVPATNLETAGASLSASELAQAFAQGEFLGLGEMMNFPGVLQGNSEVLAKLQLSRLRDGHAPGLRGKALNAYLTAGLRSDHETTSLAEGEEKLRRGMYLMIREGSSEKNLEALLPLVNDQTFWRCLLVVDDRTCLDLLLDGELDAVVRKAISCGLDPLRALQMATIVPALYFGLADLGAVAPGYRANLVVLSDLASFQVDLAFYEGRLVARDGQPLFPLPVLQHQDMARTVHMKPFPPEALALPSPGGPFPVIEVIPDQILTRRRDEVARVEGGLVVSDPERDLLKLAVVERHRATGNIGKGLVRGFGLKRGALASSVAHDSHNIIAVGVRDADIYLAVREMERLQGGLVVVAEGQVLGSLPLPIAGLLSPEPVEVVAGRLAELHRLARELGCPLPSPFATLSFLALPVIPELRLSDLGLVDVAAGRLLAGG